MKLNKIILFCLTLICCVTLKAQLNDSLMAEIRLMTKETDPVVSLKKMKEIIEKYDLDEEKNAETIDIMKGVVSMNYLKAGCYKDFDKMVSSMQNKFNQTSYLSMGASALLEDDKDPEKAESLAKRALDLYMKIKDDPKARPDGFPEKDWNRFMEFAYYPYCDTYAKALFARGKYKEALYYQEESFDDGPENGMLSSVERYSKLLVLNNQSDKAYTLLLEMISTGKSTEDMNELLKELYVKREGSDADFEKFFDKLQENVVKTLKEKLKPKMQQAAAPTFTLKDTEGNMVSLSDFKGKTVIIDFWATWCIPCKASFPAMQKMQERHPEVKFLFIATQEKPEGAVERVRKYIAANKYPFHVLMDQQGSNPELFQVMSAYKVDGIPAKFVIDANGVQRFSSVGFTSDTELINELEAMIQLAGEK